MSISNYKAARDKLTFRDDVEEEVDEVDEELEEDSDEESEDDDEDTNLIDELK